ncbi:MAG: glycosyltransferase family 4 protein [Chloroflexota bacterium]
MLPNHVLFVMLAPFVSGAEHQTLALCRYLQQRCRVTLLVNDELGELLRSDPFLSAYTTALSIETVGKAFPAKFARSPVGALRRGALYPKLQLRLARSVRHRKPDLVHLMLAPSFFAYLPLFWMMGIPSVMTLAGEMRYVRHFYGAAKRLSVRAAVRMADGLIACSADELANLRAVEPAHAARATVLDNFTDVARWAPQRKDPNRVAYAARLHPEKAPILFVEAAAQVAESHPGARFALYGRGELGGEVDARIAALSLGGRIQRGFLTDLAPLFGGSSIFVSCQLHENLGSSSLLEAMAAGNAVVATDVGQTRQIVDESVGVLVEPTGDAIAAGIRRLLDEPDATARKGRAARERVLAGYGPDRYIDRLLEVYARVLEGKRGSHSAAAQSV